jgi:potassium uptake Trk family protein
VNNTQERNIDHEERGVRGRDIVVLHDSTQPNATADDVAAAGDMDDFHEKLGTITEKEKAPSSNESGPNAKGESSESGSERARDIEAKHQPQIKFADQVKRSNGLADEDLRMPIQRSQEEHIAFLQRQRIRDGDDQDAVLRIPGPRDADAGVAPVAVEESDTLDRVLSRQSENEDHFTSLGANDQPRNSRNARPRNIDFAEPTRPTRSPPAEHVAENVSAFKHTLGIFFWWMKKPEVLHSEENHNDEENGLHATHSRIRGLINALSRDKEEEETPYLSWQPTIGRNSAFQNLTETQREELGGIEYRSLKALAVVLTFYNVGFSLFGVLCLLPWIQLSKTYGSIIDMFNQGRTWWAIFTANSAFTDLGFTLTPNSMASFNDAVWPLLLMSFLIVIGNTGFPIMLRIIIWVMSKCVPRYSGIYEELKFLLDHPRRCFTLLFPGQATWVLFWILVGLNGLDLILFIVLDVSIL